MEAIENGYSEGIALNTNGLISEGSGENIFLVQDKDLLLVHEEDLLPVQEEDLLLGEEEDLLLLKLEA